MNETLPLNETSEHQYYDEIEGKALERLTEVVPIAVPIIFTLIIIIGFVGNLLVVLVVILNKKMRNTTNILIFNLAVSLRRSNTRRGLWPQAAFWVLCLICDKQIVDIFEMYPQRAQQAGGISKGSL